MFDRVTDRALPVNLFIDSERERCCILKLDHGAGSVCTLLIFIHGNKHTCEALMNTQQRGSSTRCITG